MDSITVRNAPVVSRKAVSPLMLEVKPLNQAFPVLTLLPFSPDDSRVEESGASPAGSSGEYDGDGRPKAVSTIADKGRGYRETKGEGEACGESHEVIALSLARVCHVST